MKGLRPVHTARLATRVRRIWPELGLIGQQYTLIGGTAIALYCDHRESVDIALSCAGRAEHPRTIRKNTPVELGKHKVLQRRHGVVVKFFATENSPKVEIHGTDPWKLAAPRLRADNGLYIAAPCDLAARKLVAMIERDSARDGEDLQALLESGTDIGTATRHLVDHLKRESVERLWERLQANPQERWPHLGRHQQVVKSLENAASGTIEPAPSGITFDERESNTFEVVEEEIETGTRRVLTTARSIRGGLEWLARSERINANEIPVLQRRLELDLRRERERGRTR